MTLTGDPGVRIDGVEYDSRLVRPGGLFIAVKGFAHDGYDFVKQARERGAVAVMGERGSCDNIDNHVTVPDARKAMATVAARFYGHPSRRMKICGVTGTNGKTTTCYLLRGMFKAEGLTPGLLTSQTYDTTTETFPAERTTPESLDMQRLLFLMQKNNCDSAVVEVSSHALALNRVDEIEFAVAIYTNLTRDHLDFHKTMPDYLKAKAMLIDRLTPRTGQVVINLDVPQFESLLGRPEQSYLTYSLENAKADVHLSEYSINADGSVFNLVTKQGQRKIKFPLPGRFNLTNAVAAATGGVACGLSFDSIVWGLQSARPVPGRFNYVDAGQPFAIYIDYAHTPDAIERLCQSAREITKGRLLILFGCGGDRDRGKRPLMGKAATSSADYAVLTSDNPRSEDPLAIIEDIKPGLTGTDYEICPDRETAIEKILSAAAPGDAVLLAGKGDENYQEIKGKRYPFSDAEQARDILAKLGYTKAEK